jgi:hypothetical protein
VPRVLETANVSSGCRQNWTGGEFSAAIKLASSAMVN